MSSLRANKTKGIGDISISTIKDFQTDEITDLVSGETKPAGIPQSNVLLYELGDDSRLVVFLVRLRPDECAFRGYVMFFRTFQIDAHVLTFEFQFSLICHRCDQKKFCFHRSMFAIASTSRSMLPSKASISVIVIVPPSFHRPAWLLRLNTRFSQPLRNFSWDLLFVTIERYSFNSIYKYIHTKIPYIRIRIHARYNA